MAKSEGLSNRISEFINELYKAWRQDRKTRERQWNKAIDAFLGNLDGYWKPDEAEGWRSDYFAMLIKTKVVSAYAIVCDTILQGGEIPFDLNIDPDEPEELRVFPEGMRKKIRRQLLDCKADRELMNIILSMALYGKGIAKCPVVNTYTKIQYEPVSFAPPFMMANQNQFVRFIPRFKIVSSPGMEYVSVWNIFSDPEEDNLQDGYGIIQREMYSAYDLRKLINAPFFNKRAIKKVLSEVNSNTFTEDVSSLPPSLREIAKRNKTIQYLEYWGRIPKKLLIDYTRKNGVNSLARDFAFNDTGIEGNEFEGHICIANGELIRLTDNPVGYRPYSQAFWEVVLDSSDGRSIADNLEHDQKMSNGIMRAIIDNLRLAGNVMFAGKSEAFIEGKPKFKPGFWAELSAEVDDVRQAIQQIVVNDVSQGLLAVWGVIQRLADENTNLPKIISGEIVTQKKQETAFEIDQRIQNAGKYLGSVIRNIDEGIIESVITHLYHYNMIQPGNEEIKGNFVVNATGFNSFQNRFLRTQSIKQTLALVLSHPSLTAEARIRPHLEEIYKSLDLKPETFLKSEEEKARDQQMALQQQMQMMQIAQQKEVAKIQRDLADMKKKLSEALMYAEKAKTERAKQLVGVAGGR